MNLNLYDFLDVPPEPDGTVMSVIRAVNYEYPKKRKKEGVK